MPLIGRPMLSTMLVSSSGGMTLADRRLDLVAQPRRLLDAGADLGAHVQLDLAAVDGREEILAEERRQPERQPARRQGSRRRSASGRASASASSRAIAAAQPLEPVFEARAGSARSAVARRRGQRVAGRPCVVMRLCRAAGSSPVSAPACARGRTSRPARTPPPRPAAEQDMPATPPSDEHRHEHDADAQQRDEGRHHDLLGAVHDRVARSACPVRGGS